MKNINLTLLTLFTLLTLSDAYAKTDSLGALAGYCRYKEKVEGQYVNKYVRSPLINPGEKVGLKLNRSSKIFVFANSTHKGHIQTGYYTNRVISNPPRAALYRNITIAGHTYKIYLSRYEQLPSQRQLVVDKFDLNEEFTPLEGVGFDQFFSPATITTTRPDGSPSTSRFYFRESKKESIENLSTKIIKEEFVIGWDNDQNEPIYMNCTFEFKNKNTF